MAAVLATFGLTLENCSSEDEPLPTLENQLTIDMSNPDYSILLDDGGWLFHPSKVLLVNVAGTISAFSSICPHAGCSDQWSFNGNFICRCHSSTFDTSGQVISGPASKNLTRIAVTRNGDILKVG